MALEPLIPANGLSFLGKAGLTPKMAVVLSISEDDIKSMERSAKNVQFVAGPTPMFQFGNRSIDLTMSPEKFTRELYHSSTSDKLHLVGHISHRARSTKRSTAKHEEQDEAVLALTSSMAAYKKEKEASQTHLANGFLPIPKNRREAAAQQKRGGLLAASKHMSPAAAATRTPAQAPTSIPIDHSSQRTRAMRTAIAHFLAMGDASLSQITSKTHIPEAEAKSLLQTMAQSSERGWKLSDKSFKELDVWNFRYAEEKDRIAAIDNAVRAYDRMRLSKDDKLWQLLLRKSERGQGKVLSRLHINNNPHVSTPRTESPIIQPDSHQSSAANTPRLGPAGTPKIGSKKPGGDVMKRLLSKDPKKARAVDEAKEKKRKERQSQEDDPRPTKKQALSTSKKNPAIKSEEFIHSSDEEDASEVTKHATEDNRSKSHGRSLSKNEPMEASPSKGTSNTKSTSSTNTTSKTNNGKSTPQLPQSSAAKGRTHISPPKTVTRPTVPSPLGAARPRVTSDVSDRSGISSHKRAADGPRGLSSTSVRKRHDTITGVDSGEETRSRLKNSDTKMTNTFKDKPANAAAKTNDQTSRKSSASTSANTQSSEERFDGGTSDSSASFIDTITFSQGVDLAQKFKTHYYPQYAKLYDTIADKRHGGEAVDDQEFDKLYVMQARLEQMKREIEAASGRQRNENSS